MNGCVFVEICASVRDNTIRSKCVSYHDTTLIALLVMRQPYISKKQSSEIRQARDQQKLATSLLSKFILPGLIFDNENGDIFFENLGSLKITRHYSPQYHALQLPPLGSRVQYSIRQWYATFFLFEYPLNRSSLQLCTPRVVGEQIKLHGQ
jgi:hypothetical protein